MTNWDVIIAGGGIIGLSTACELRRRGANVLLLERGEPGREASSAAAGMLAACDPETPPALQAFARECARVYPQFVANIETASGIAVDLRRQGTITLEPDGHAAMPAEYRKLSNEELRKREPALEANGLTPYFVQEDCVDPDLLVQALTRTAEQAGVEIRRGVAVSEMRPAKPTPGQIEVATSAGAVAGKAAIDCRGSWSGAPVKPRKGHMLYVQPPRSGLVQHVVRAPDSYIVPRSSGKILLGTTVEDAGFDKTVDQAVIRRLHAAAVRYFPELEHAPVIATWTGLRPGTPDDLPLMGATGTPGIFVASGHFRNGILLAPLTAQVMADMVAGNPPSLDVSAYSPLRFATQGK